MSRRNGAGSNEQKAERKANSAGDEVTVLRHCADGAARIARGVVEFAASGGRFYVVNVELPPCAFRHETIRMRETFWPENVSREMKR